MGKEFRSASCKACCCLGADEWLSGRSERQNILDHDSSAIINPMKHRKPVKSTALQRITKAIDGYVGMVPSCFFNSSSVFSSSGFSPRSKAARAPLGGSSFGSSYRHQPNKQPH